MKPSNNILSLLPKNAGMHNSIYRGEDITDLFYDGTLSKQIAAGTFDDIFIGDYIIGKESQRKYLVADLDYYFNRGDTKTTKHHILMVPEKNIGTGQMNTTASAEGAYYGSQMYKTNLTPIKTIIKNDFGTDHILTFRNILANAIEGDYEKGTSFYNSDIELMDERMVVGNRIFANFLHGSNRANLGTLNPRQLNLFRLNLSTIISEENYWLRDVADKSSFCVVLNSGSSWNNQASTLNGIRPVFLVY